MYAIVVGSEDSDKAKRTLHRFSITPDKIIEKSPFRLLFRNPYLVRHTLEAMLIAKIKARLVFHV